MLNPLQYAKLELFTYGMRVSQAAKDAIQGDKERPLSSAEFASTTGIPLNAGNVWVNAPVAEYNPNFVGKNTKWMLDYKDNEFFLVSPELKTNAEPVRVPAYWTEHNEKGIPYSRLVMTHTDRVRISPIRGCSRDCKFCDVSYTQKYEKNNVDDLVDAVEVALKDKITPARHVLISGGTPKPEDHGYLKEVYRRVATAFPGVEIDVMMMPIQGLLDSYELKDIGIHGVSTNMELYNNSLAKNLMPKKHEVAPKERYLQFIEEAVPVFGEGNVRSLLMVGLEPMDDTLLGVEAIARIGGDPVLSPFRPDPRSPLGYLTPPSVDFLAETYEKATKIVEEYGVKLGPRCKPCTHNTLTF